MLTLCCIPNYSPRFIYRRLFSFQRDKLISNFSFFSFYWHKMKLRNCEYFALVSARNEFFAENLSTHFLLKGNFCFLFFLIFTSLSEIKAYSGTRFLSRKFQGFDLRFESTKSRQIGKWNFAEYIGNSTIQRSSSRSIVHLGRYSSHLNESKHIQNPT